MEPSRVNFGSRFKQEREARHLSLGDVARVTKIPERSLERLEAGRFEELPAEVFVRGFVRSFARAVGLDPEDMARRYGEIVSTSSPKLEVSLAGAVRAAAARAVTVAKAEEAAAHAPVAARAPSVAPVVRDAAPVEPAGAAVAIEPFEDEGIVVVRKAGKPERKRTASDTTSERKPEGGPNPAPPVGGGERKRAPVEDEMRTLSKAILDAGRETRRLPLTLAVIILVIVATLTMSLLLNRPSHIGDGITQRSVPSDAAARA